MSQILFPTSGSVTYHIKESHGGSKNPFCHYATQYNVEYGRHWINRDMKREPRPGNNYMWKKRVRLGYRPQMDDYDNPLLKPDLRYNYLSTTHKHFYKDPLVLKCDSFFDNHRPIIPTEYVLNREWVPLPSNHNPNDWGTTYKSQFNNKPPKYIDIHHSKSVGGKHEESGFSLNQPIFDTLDRRPNYTYCGDWPSPVGLDRPTGTTHYNDTYHEYPFLTGKEPLPDVVPGSNRSSGYVMGNKARPDFVVPTSQMIPPKNYTPAEIAQLKKTDPAQYISALHPDHSPSTTHATYTDPGKVPPTKQETLNLVKVGDKEPSGFVSNQDRFMPKEDLPGQWITHYWTKYYDPTVNELERMGHVDFQTNPILPDAYVKNNGLIQYVKEPHPPPVCSGVGYLDAYQQRSYSARDFVAR